MLGSRTCGRRWLAALMGALMCSCAHREPERAPRKKQDVSAADLPAALEPCPTGLETKSVREILAQKWPKRSCFAVRGRLTAMYGNPPVLHYLSAGEHLGSGQPAPADVPAAAPATSRWPVRPLGWVLTDLADPFNPRRDEMNRDAQPTISLMTAGNYEPSLLPLQRCNRNDDGKPIMPARTRLELPNYGMTDVERLNAGLAGLTVVVFGGHNARDFNPDWPASFDSMGITHVCRLEAPADAGAQAGD